MNRVVASGLRGIVVASSLTFSIAMVLSGYSSFRPLSSNSPARVIALTASLMIRQAFGGETVLPVGDYRATLEDSNGYYFTAPAKLIRKKSVGRQFDGGLYLLKGSPTLTHYFVVGQHHATGLYRLNVQPQYELKP